MGLKNGRCSGKRQIGAYGRNRTEYPEFKGVEMEKYVVVLVTTSSREEAEDIAFKLISSGLTPCVNIIPKCHSIYQWKDELHRDEEALMFIKARSGDFEALVDAVTEYHSYDVPEVIALEVDSISPKYLAFLDGFFK